MMQVGSLNVLFLQACFGFLGCLGGRHGSTAVTHPSVSQSWLFAYICFWDALPCSLLFYRFKLILDTLIFDFRCIC